MPITCYLYNSCLTLLFNHVVISSTKCSLLNSEDWILLNRKFCSQIRSQKPPSLSTRIISFFSLDINWDRGELRISTILGFNVESAVNNMIIPCPWQNSLSAKCFTWCLDCRFYLVDGHTGCCYGRLSHWVNILIILMLIDLLRTVWLLNEVLHRNCLLSTLSCKLLYL